MSIFDILTNGLSGLGGLGGLGRSGGSGFNIDSIGSVLESFAGSAKSAARDFTQKAPGGVGGLMGAGALGAVLGNLMSGDMARNIALVGAGAVAWNFYKKWANKSGAQNDSQAAPTGAAAAGTAAVHAVDAGGAVDPVTQLIARSMVYAAKADGKIDPVEEQRMDSVLKSFGDENLEPFIAKIREEPIDPEKLAKQVTSPEQGEDVFRLSCTVVDIDHFMERGYLDALAKALGINDTRKKEIEQEAEEARGQFTQAITAS